MAGMGGGGGGMLGGLMGGGGQKQDPASQMPAVQGSVQPGAKLGAFPGASDVQSVLGSAGQPPTAPSQAAGSPAATQADILRLQQAQQRGAQPVFGGDNDMRTRIAQIQQLLAGQGGGGGPTQVRKSAQPLMGA
jgi:hypothetical protein